MYVSHAYFIQPLFISILISTFFIPRLLHSVVSLEFDFASVPPAILEAVKASLAVTQLPPTPTSTTTSASSSSSTSSSLSSSTVPINVRIAFAPMRTFRADATLVLTDSAGNSWNTLLHLRADMPAFDDTIKLAASTHARSAVAFTIENKTSSSQQQHAVPFECLVMSSGLGSESGSASEFAVEPRSGVSSASGGIDIKVTYAPTRFTARNVAELIVNSPTCTWRFKLVGEPPKYSPPPSVKLGSTQASQRK